MKKSTFLFPLTLLAASLASCSFSIAISTTQSSSSAESSSQKISHSSAESSPSSSKEATSFAPSEDGKVKLAYDYTDYSDNEIYPIDSAPTLGKAKLLVIPVWFTDSSSYITSAKKETVREDIRIAYFGTREETGWHSVKSFYETESMGALTLEGTVSEWYEVGKMASVYGGDESGIKTDALVKDASDWYFVNNPSESRKDYDGDGDGYLDGVMLIYAAPNYVDLDDESYSNFWAYCYWLQQESAQDKENPGANTYFWASYDFMYGSDTVRAHTGKSGYSYGNTDHCKIDAHTYIHEMGHVFGLDDYYDYGPNGYSPAAGFSMQDANVGGHDPFSVMAFGWADPFIPTESCEITISAFQKSHDLILLTPGMNSYLSPWDEYLLLELYTPTGLNELDSNFTYENIAGPKQTGVRLWHVDARLASCDALSKSGQPVFNSTLTSDLSAGKYGVVQAFTNTMGDDDYGSPLGSSYDKYNLLQLIRNSKTTTYKSKATIKASDLFGDGSSFSMSDFRGQFANSGKLNSNKSLGWSFSVSISGSGEDALAKISLVKE